MRLCKHLVGGLVHSVQSVMVENSIVTIFITIKAQPIKTKEAIWGGVECVYLHFKGSLYH